MKHRFCLWVLLFILPLLGYSQTNVDSIAKKSNTLSEKEKLDSDFAYCDSTLYINPDTVFSLVSYYELFINEDAFKKWQGELFYIKANYDLLIEKYDSALYYFDRSLKELPPNHSDKILASMVNASFLEARAGNAEKSYVYINDAQHELVSSANQKLQGLFFHQKANINVLEDNYPDASNLFQEAINQYRLADDEISIGRVYTDIAMMYSKIANYPMGIDFLDKAEIIFDKANAQYLLAKCKLQKGNAFLNSAKFNDALLSFTDAESLWLNLNDSEKLGQVYTGMGKAHEKLLNYDLSFVYLQKALKLMLAIHNKNGEAEVNIYLGDLSTKKGNIIKAQNHYLKSLLIITNVELKLELYDKLSQNYSVLNDFKKAYKYQILYNSLNQDILNKKSDIRLKRVADKMSKEIEVREFKNEQLQQELSDFSETKNAFVFFYRMLIVFLLVILGLTILIGNKKFKRNKVLFNQLKSTIRSQRNRLGKSKFEYDKLKKSSERIFSITSKNMWEPFWVLERLSNQLITDDDKQNKASEKVSFDNDQLIMARNLLENVLHWVKNQQGLLEFNPKMYKINDLLDPLVKTQAVRARAKNIEIQYSPQFNLMVYTDKTTMEIAIRNIIENAIKFSTLNGVVSIRVSSSSNTVEVKITDNGVGMTKDQISALFSTRRPYMASGTHGEKGVGLGLSLTKEFIERNNGVLKIESSIALGTTICVNLPATDKQANKKL